jgi:hypothetical protein
MMLISPISCHSRGAGINFSLPKQLLMCWERKVDRQPFPKCELQTLSGASPHSIDRCMSSMPNLSRRGYVWMQVSKITSEAKSLR